MRGGDDEHRASTEGRMTDPLEIRLSERWHYCPKCPDPAPALEASSVVIGNTEHDMGQRYIEVVCPIHGNTGLHDPVPDGVPDAPYPYECWCEK